MDWQPFSTLGSSRLLQMLGLLASNRAWLLPAVMTSQLVTGKVTFVKEWGTAPPNSTGASAYDYLSLINDFTLA